MRDQFSEGLCVIMMQKLLWKQRSTFNMEKTFVKVSITTLLCNYD